MKNEIVLYLSAAFGLVIVWGFIYIVFGLF